MSIIDSPVTGAGLGHFRRMRRLRYLVLSRTRIASLEALKDLSAIESLTLTGAPIDDAGLAPVARLENLFMFYISQTAISDAGLAHLAGLRRLQDLHLSYTQIGDTGIPQILRSPALVGLHLDGTAVTDDSLVQIARVTGLQVLSLDDTRITDRGLGYLSTLTRCFAQCPRDRRDRSRHRVPSATAPQADD